MNTWIMPLHCITDNRSLKLLAPNRYVLNYLKKNLHQRIEQRILAMDIDIDHVRFEIGSYGVEPPKKVSNQSDNPDTSESAGPYKGGIMNPGYTFDTHVEGTSNQLARAAALQVGRSPGKSFNPLFIYGGVGLGKTHLMQAAGNLLLNRNPKAKVVYVRSELFVNDMVKALKNNTMNLRFFLLAPLSMLLFTACQPSADTPPPAPTPTPPKPLGARAPLIVRAPGKAPRVNLQSTHRRALEVVPMEALREMSTALN